MARIRYAGQYDARPCRVVCHGRCTTIYLHADLTLPQRRAALRAARNDGLTAGQILRGAVADRARTAFRATGRLRHAYPVTCLLTLAMLNVIAITYMAYVTGNLPLANRPPAVTAPATRALGVQAGAVTVGSRHGRGGSPAGHGRAVPGSRRRSASPAPAPDPSPGRPGGITPGPEPSGSPAPDPVRSLLHKILPSLPVPTLTLPPLPAPGPTCLQVGLLGICVPA